MELKNLTCKCCMAPLDPAKAAGRVVRCEFCGTAFVLAREDEGKVVAFLRSGELLLDTCKFDDAFTAYQKAAELDKSEPEAFFGMALSTFKVQYLKDEVNNRLQPICHEISDKMFTDDKNYQRALQLATPEQREEYVRRGEEINAIRREFGKLKESGLDYDCFLCVKVSDTAGGTTQDSHEALRLYHYLKERGYSPFYSEEEIKGRAGADYEALILYALYTSQCMLIVCSDDSYLQTKWMKNEYTRFMKIVEREGKEDDAITFVFRGRPIEHLPGKNGKLQGIDLAQPDAYTRVDRFVENHTPEARARRAEEEKHKNLTSSDLLSMLREAQEAEEKKKQAEAQKLYNEEEAKRRQEEARKKREEELRKEAELIRAREAAKREQETASREQAQKSLLFAANCTVKRGVLKKYKRGVADIIYLPEKVKEIGDYAFARDNSIKAVYLPAGVTRIGKMAFYGCLHLEKIVIPEGVIEIGQGAFTNCEALEEIALPKGLLSIGAEAFDGCIKLKNLLIPQSVVSLGKGVDEKGSPFDRPIIKNCLSLKNVVVENGNKEFLSEGNCIIKRGTAVLLCGCPNSVIPKGVTKIAHDAFRECHGLKNIEIPDSVTSIGARAFMSIGSGTVQARFANVNSYSHYDYGESNSYKGLKSVTFGKNVEMIGAKAFAECDDLERIDLPDSVTAIGESAFSGCKDMKEAILGNGLVTIGEKAFHQCDGLTSIIIPNSVKTIGSGAFTSIEYGLLASSNIKSVIMPKRLAGLFKSRLKKIFGPKSKAITYAFTK